MAQGYYLDIDPLTGDLLRERAVDAGPGAAHSLIRLGSDLKIAAAFIPDMTAPVDSIICSEDIADYAVVNLHNSGGRRCRYAVATDANKRAMGFVVTGAVSGNPVNVYLAGKLRVNATGLTADDLSKLVFLSATPGTLTKTPPTTLNQFVQIIGQIADFITGAPSEAYIQLRIDPRLIKIAA